MLLDARLIVSFKHVYFTHTAALFQLRLVGTLQIYSVQTIVGANKNSITPLDCQRIKEYVTLSEDCAASRTMERGWRGQQFRVRFAVSHNFRVGITFHCKKLRRSFKFQPTNFVKINRFHVYKYLCDVVMVKLYEFNVKKLRELNTMPAYTRQKAKSKYRNRIRLEIFSQKQSSDTHKTLYDRVKRCRERKINIKASERVNVDVFTQNKRPSWIDRLPYDVYRSALVHAVRRQTLRPVFVKLVGDPTCATDKSPPTLQREENATNVLRIVTVRQLLASVQYYHLAITAFEDLQSGSQKFHSSGVQRLAIEVFRADEGEAREKQPSSAASSDMIPTCENPVVTAPRIEPGPPQWKDHDGNTASLARRGDKALGVRVAVARIAPSLLDLGRAGARLPHHSQLVRHRSGVREALGSYPRVKAWESNGRFIKKRGSETMQAREVEDERETAIATAVLPSLTVTYSGRIHVRVFECIGNAYEEIVLTLKANAHECGDDTNMEQRRNARTGKTGDPRENTADQRHRLARLPRWSPVGNRARFVWVCGEQPNHYPTAAPLSLGKIDSEMQCETVSPDFVIIGFFFSDCLPLWLEIYRRIHVEELDVKENELRSYSVSRRRLRLTFRAGCQSRDTPDTRVKTEPPINYEGASVSRHGNRRTTSSFRLETVCILLAHLRLNCHAVNSSRHVEIFLCLVVAVIFVHIVCPSQLCDSDIKLSIFNRNAYAHRSTLLESNRLKHALVCVIDSVALMKPFLMIELQNTISHLVVSRPKNGDEHFRGYRLTSQVIYPSGTDITCEKLSFLGMHIAVMGEPGVILPYNEA
ncbi:hypothetical protein PR048_020611 [Dryococelus australis]|uniref:Uncharacterized protein n=1 Tax=Dryococelus australis TaxID=614101 RepID=A0ABQ9H6S2_9NEOP|nr:hypothetical protein PR048_020611 [Dryococelus australis]